jgi:hypothetical protein
MHLKWDKEIHRMGTLPFAHQSQSVPMGTDFCLLPILPSIRLDPGPANWSSLDGYLILINRYQAGELSR